MLCYTENAIEQETDIRLGKLIDYARAHNIAVLNNEPLSKHTTFKIGGPAKYFIFAESSHFPEIIRCAALDGIKTAVIGKGSNILASDDGFDGLVLTMKSVQITSPEKGVLLAGGGTSLAALSMAAQSHQLTGLEFAMGIPGTVGGAVVMNAGAYEGEMSMVVEHTVFYDCMQPEAGLIVLKGEEHEFSYRHSFFSDKPELIIFAAAFRLKTGSIYHISEKMLSFSEKRKAKQPIEYPSAGSVFKRPENNYAGKLIEDCGLRGLQIGGAQVSEKHAGFIVNRGGATARDVRALIEKIESTVLEQTGVQLIREIRFLE